MAEVPQLMTRVESEPESSANDDDDGMCDYEKRRLENIRKNHSILRSLGMILCRRDMIILRTSQRRTPHYSGRFILIQWCPIYVILSWSNGALCKCITYHYHITGDYRGRLYYHCIIPSLLLIQLKCH